VEGAAVPVRGEQLADEAGMSLDQRRTQRVDRIDHVHRALAVGEACEDQTVRVAPRRDGRGRLRDGEARVAEIAVLVFVFVVDRLGVRVPAVIVSPYIPKGTILHDVFDHTSIIATARKLFLAGKPNTWLTERDRNANTFEGCLTLAISRSDKPAIPEPSGAGAASAAAAASTSDGSSSKTKNGKLSELQQVGLVQMISLETQKAKKNSETGTIVPKTEQEAAKYLQEVQVRLKLGKSTTKK
jgi:hypothetical protein